MPSFKIISLLVLQKILKVFPFYSHGGHLGHVIDHLYKHLFPLPNDAPHEKVQVGIDQEKAQSEKDSRSENRGGEKTKLTIRAQLFKTSLA